MATMEVDTVGTLCRATEAAWGWVTPDMASGLGGLLSSRTSF